MPSKFKLLQQCADGLKRELEKKIIECDVKQKELDDKTLEYNAKQKELDDKILECNAKQADVEHKTIVCYHMQVYIDQHLEQPKQEKLVRMAIELNDAKNTIQKLVSAELAALNVIPVNIDLDPILSTQLRDFFCVLDMGVQPSTGTSQRIDCCMFECFFKNIPRKISY